LQSWQDMPCAVCDQTSQTVVWRENGYDGLLCACGTVYVSPEPPPGAIDPRRDNHPDTFYSQYAAFKAKWIQGLRRSGRLLEVGCGEGHFLRAAQTLGFNVAGVEVDPERARRVGDALGVEVRCSRLEDLEWPEASFHVVYHCDLLSHFADPLQALHKMRGLLARGGILVMEAGTLGNIRPFWYRSIGEIGFPQHRWLYSEESLRELLARAGLAIVRIRHFGLAPAVALYRSRVIATKWMQRIRGCPSEQQNPITPPANSESRRHAERAYECLEQFFRYRIGAIAPRIGPATWLIAARPADEFSI
jgi:SAM-dependent methyltransferase